MKVKSRTVAVALLLSGAAAATAGAAWAQTATPAAHGAHGHFAAVKGTVTAVSGTSLQVTTASGTQAYALASGTHIIKVSKGTTADLVKNARVELHLVSGTTTADAVEVDLIAKGQGTKAPGTKPAHSGTPRPTPSTTPTAPRHGRPARIGTAGATPKRGAHAGGQIVSVSGNTITVSSWNGQQASYTLTNTVTITKVSAGNASDLAKGQTVQVVATSSNTAVEVTILAS